MYRVLLDILVDPVSKAPLELEEYRSGAGDSIVEGMLHGADGRSYAITNGIPRFVLTQDCNQRQTESSFGFKWQQWKTHGSSRGYAQTQQWLTQRYGFETLQEMRSFFASRQRILDAGCGSGFSTSLWMDSTWRGAMWVGIDISVAIDLAQERLGFLETNHFLQADALQPPFAEGSFDTIFSEGVLHHTPSTEVALKTLVPLLECGGELMFYIYRKKAPVREFTDDYVRGIVSAMEPAEASAALRPLTKLGQALAELHAEVEVPDDIPYLGIKAGRYDVQRLIYWHFAKLFWNAAYSFEENNHVNFDWYHPRYAHRQTEEEVRRWCDESGLSIRHFDKQESGFTVRAIKD